jgi:uncharacterized protein (TIGR02594 family)
VRVTAYSVAERFLGTKEKPGPAANPLVLAMLQRSEPWVEDDATAWCSAFAGAIAWILDLPRPRKETLPAGVSELAARSWLRVGEAIAAADAKVGWDVVVLSRGRPPQPGPDVLKASGHVGFFAGWTETPGKRFVRILGGNQGDAVSFALYDAADILGIRRLFDAPETEPVRVIPRAAAAPSPAVTSSELGDRVRNTLSLPPLDRVQGPDGSYTQLHSDVAYTMARKLAAGGSFADLDFSVRDRILRHFPTAVTLAARQLVMDTAAAAGVVGTAEAFGYFQRVHGDPFQLVEAEIQKYLLEWRAAPP